MSIIRVGYLRSDNVQMMLAQEKTSELERNYGDRLFSVRGFLYPNTKLFLAVCRDESCYLCGTQKEAHEFFSLGFKKAKQQRER